jgi:dihydroflavonol-4-reductase
MSSPSTVLITGLSGFIARQTALELLGSGIRVRGTVRDLSRGRALLESLERAGADRSSVELVTADLERDEGWADAVLGVDAVLHLASPFPIQQPRGRLDLVPAARDGTLRVLKAVKQRGDGVARVVLTSSIAAMMYRAGRSSRFPIREADWSDPEWPPSTPYIISKTLAERAAWDWARAHEFEDRLVVINPGFVLGPALDGKAATSIDVIGLILKGAYPAVPPVSYPVVDVRDLARLHAAALSAEGVAGRRLIACEGSLSMAEMARILKEEFPDHAKKAPTATLPAPVVRLLALFDRSLRTVLPDLNVIPQPENAYVTELTGVAFRPSREAVIATARSLIDRGAV